VKTVIVYEDEPVMEKKKTNVETSLGPNIGVAYNFVYPLYKYSFVTPTAGLSFHHSRGNVFFRFSPEYQCKRTIPLSYNQTFETVNSHMDTVKIVEDEFIQIVGTDTIREMVYSRKYILKSDTVVHDSSLTVKNSYSTVRLPIFVGYGISKKKSLIGLALGVQCRIMINSEFNKIVRDNSSPVYEKNYLRQVCFDAALQLLMRQKIAKHAWLSEMVYMNYPLSSNYRNYSPKANQLQASLSIGLEFSL